MSKEAMTPERIAELREPRWMVTRPELLALLDIADAAMEAKTAMQEFVRKVDAGEARSVKSYAQMKAALARLRKRCGRKNG